MRVHLHAQRGEVAVAEPLPAGGDWPDDAALIQSVRAGDTGAFGVLYARYEGTARRVAGALCASVFERDDLVAEAFTQVLRALRTGTGPTTGFRPYLLTTMRNLEINASRHRRATTLVDAVPEPLRAAATNDPVGDRVLAGVAAAAFLRLPPRWQTVLWHTEIEGQSPAMLASMLGLTANGVAALACRAREGLRQAYLDVHLPATQHTACRAIRPHLASWVRRGMPRHGRTRVTTHLDRCAECRGVAVTLVTINRSLGAVPARHLPPTNTD